MAKKRARKQEHPDPDDSDDARVEGPPLEIEEVYLRCQLPQCDYEEVCEVRNDRLTFSEYYCPRDGHFLVVLSRPRVR